MNASHGLLSHLAPSRCRLVAPLPQSLRKTLQEGHLVARARAEACHQHSPSPARRPPPRRATCRARPAGAACGVRAQGTREPALGCAPPSSVAWAWRCAPTATASRLRRVLPRTVRRWSTRVLLLCAAPDTRARGRCAQRPPRRPPRPPRGAGPCSCAGGAAAAQEQRDRCRLAAGSPYTACGAAVAACARCASCGRGPPRLPFQSGSEGAYAAPRRGDTSLRAAPHRNAPECTRLTRARLGARGVAAGGRWRAADRGTAAAVSSAGSVPGAGRLCRRSQRARLPPRPLPRV
jgi:hypothetical protein